MNYQTILSKLEFFNWKYHSVSVGSICEFLVIAIAVFVGLRWLQRASVRRLKRFASQTSTTLDDLTLGLIRHTQPIVLLIVALYVGSLALPLGPAMAANVRLVLLLAVLWQVGLWGHEVINYALEELNRRRAGEDAGLQTAAGALRFVARLALWSLLVMIALNNLHVNITTLVAGLGVGGIAVALAVQNILGDLFASLSIILDRPFAVGHFIVVDSISGTVDHVGLRTTRVRSLSGEEIVVSNTDLLKSRIHNYKMLFERRVLFGFGVTYDTGYEKLAGIPSTVREIIEGVPKTRFDRAHFKEYGDSSLNFEVVYFIQDPDYNVYMDIQQAINLELYRRFEHEHIEFAFPTRTLYLANGDLSAARSPGDSASEHHQ
jgi:small-conductance mechanosensitive channel